MRDRPTYTWTVYMWDTAFQGVQDRGYARGDRLGRHDRMLSSSPIMFWVFRSRD